MLNFTLAEEAAAVEACSKTTLKDLTDVAATMLFALLSLSAAVGFCLFF